MAAAPRPGIATEVRRRFVDVELRDGPSRGQTVVDHLGATGRDSNVDAVLRIDRDAFLGLLQNALG
jgi:inosine-uridine nucleoside N-ribohydrolase